MKYIIKLSGLFTFLFIAAALFNTNISGQTKSEIWIVADQKMNCTGVAPSKCLQVKHLNEEKYSLMYQNIENFDFIEGYFYVLNVSVSTVKNPPADASKYKYRLKKVLARVKSENSMMPTTQNLSGTDWKLMRIEGQNVNTDKAFIRFDEAKNTVGGNGGCNGFGGKLSKSGSQIEISQVFSTKMFCEATSEIENKFLGNLDRVTKYQITDGKLFLYVEEKVVLEFARKN